MAFSLLGAQVPTVRKQLYTGELHSDFGSKLKAFWPGFTSAVSSD